MKRRRAKEEEEEKRQQDELAALLDEFEAEHSKAQPVLFVDAGQRPHRPDERPRRPQEETRSLVSYADIAMQEEALQWDARSMRASQPKSDATVIPAGYAYDESSGFYYSAERSCYLAVTAFRQLFCATAECEWKYYDMNARAYRPYPAENLTDAQRALLVKMAPIVPHGSDLAAAADELLLEMAETAAPAVAEAALPAEVAAEALPPQPLPDRTQRSSVSLSLGATSGSRSAAAARRRSAAVSSATNCVGASFSDDAAPSVDAEIDWAALTCLVCRRRFASSDLLQKHVEQSVLHAENRQRLAAAAV